MQFAAIHFFSLYVFIWSKIFRYKTNIWNISLSWDISLSAFFLGYMFNLPIGGLCCQLPEIVYYGGASCALIFYFRYSFFTQFTPHNALLWAGTIGNIVIVLGLYWAMQINACNANGLSFGHCCILYISGLILRCTSLWTIQNHRSWSPFCSFQSLSTTIFSAVLWHSMLWLFMV